MHTKIGAVLVLGWLLLVAPAQAQEACRALEIPPFPGHDKVVIYDMNHWGQVVGSSFRDGPGVNTGFVWQRGRVRELEPFAAGEFALPYAINDVGQVVGEATGTQGFVPALWTADGIVRLPGEPGDRPTAINNRGVIAGSRGTSCVLWPNPRALPLVLGNLGGGFCEVHDINERSELVGMSLNASGEPHGFLYRAGAFDEVTDVRLPDGSVVTSVSSLFAINERGLAVGYTGPYFDVLTYGRSSGATGLTYGASTGATDLNDWGRLFALRESDEHLLLFERSGSFVDKGVLRGGVNGQALFANNLSQIAWVAADLRSYFCQLAWF